MFTFSTQIRVHYALTDQMGVVYHSRYLEFFEIGRVEAIRKLGFSYKRMEEMGVIMPVTELSIKYLRPVKYDELITVKIIIRQLPTGHKIVFDCEVYNEINKLCTTGEVTLFFVEAATMKRTPMPQPLAEKLFPYFETTE